MAREKIDLFIGNTDHDWFDFCKSQEGLREVNFWQPSAQPFKVMDEGGIFFFRRKSPINRIGGFGVLASAERASVGLLWDELGVSNGVASEGEFIDRVRKYRKSRYVDRSTLVGFKILVDPVFLDESDWFELPSDWSPNIVTGKGYSSNSIHGRRLIAKYHELARNTSSNDEFARSVLGLSEAPSGGFVHAKKKVRIGQRRFQLNVISAYEGRCAFSGCNVVEALEAAHIVKYADTQDHATDNGILIRKDIHALFDAGFLVIDEGYRIKLTEKFFENYGRGSDYQKLDGERINLPRSKAFWPAQDKIKKHRSGFVPID